MSTFSLTMDTGSNSKSKVIHSSSSSSSSSVSNIHTNIITECAQTCFIITPGHGHIRDTMS